jgi:hypothetical protein
MASWIIIRGSRLDDWIYWHLLYNFSESQSVTIIRNQSSAEPFFLDCRGHVPVSFSFSLILRLIPESKSMSKLCYERRFSRPVCLDVKHQSGASDQIFIAVRQLRACRCGTLSLTREGVCRLQLLLGLASPVILGSESRSTRDHILLSQNRVSPNLEGQVPVFISPCNRVAQLYPQALGSLFVASYDSQGYGGSIRTPDSWFTTGLLI